MDEQLFRNLDGYEKGVIARALLKGFIKQGNIVEDPDLPKPELVVSIEQYQMRLLSLFVDDATTSKELLMEELCNLR